MIQQIKELNSIDLTRLMSQRSSTPELAKYLTRIEKADLGIRKVLAKLSQQGLCVRTQEFPGIGTMITDTVNLEGDKLVRNAAIFEGLTELALLVARKIGDFITGLRQIEPGYNQFDIAIDDRQKLSLWGSSNAMLETQIAQNQTNVLDMRAFTETAMQDCQTDGPPNVLRTNPKFDYGFVPGSRFERVNFASMSKNKPVNSSETGLTRNSFKQYPTLSVALGRGLTGVGNGDQAYTVRLNSNDHPSGAYADDSRAFATRLAQISPVKEIALPAQFLDRRVVEKFKEESTSFAILGLPVGPRPYSPEEFAAIVAA